MIETGSVKIETATACLAMLFSVACASGDEVSKELRTLPNATTSVDPKIFRSDVFVLKDGFVIDGYIGQNAYQMFKDVTEQNRTDSLKSKVLVNSSGGEEIYAILIGKIIRKSQLDVIVDGVCLSSCANFIFPSGKRKEVKENSFVGWHGGDYHWYLHYKGEREYRTANRILKTVNIGREFYKEIGASYQIIIDSGQLVGLKTPVIFNGTIEGKDKREFVRWESQFDFWMPRPEVIESYGIEVDSEEFWHLRDKSEMEEALQKRTGTQMSIIVEPK